MSAIDQIIVKLNGALPCGCVWFGYFAAKSVGDGQIIECSACSSTFYLDELLDWQKPPPPPLSKEEVRLLGAVGLGALLGGALVAAFAKPEETTKAFNIGAAIGGALAGSLEQKKENTVMQQALDRALNRRK